MIKGFLARMGLDASGFTRGLDDTVDQARVAARKMGTEFEKGQDKAMRAMRRSHKFSKKMSRKYGKSWKAAGVAVAAGMAVSAKAMSAAAQRSDVFAQKLDRINDAKQDLMANLGEDLFGFLGPNPESSIRKLDEMRRGVVDIYAAILVGEKQVNDVNAARAAEKAVSSRMKEIRGFSDFELDLAMQSGDKDAISMLAERAFNKQLDQAAVDGRITKGQQGELTERRKNNIDAQKLRAKNNRDTNHFNETSRVELQRAQLDAQVATGANKVAREIHAERLAAKIEEDKVTREFAKNELLTEKQKIKLLIKNIDLIKDRTDARIKEIKEDKKENINRTRRGVNRQIFDNWVRELRAEGKSTEADAYAIKYSFLRSVDENKRDKNLKPSQRKLLIKSESSLALSELNRLKKGDRSSTVISAGLAGGASLRRQILGAPGDGAGAISPVVTAINEIIEIVKNIHDESKKQTSSGSLGLAAP